MGASAGRTDDREGDGPTATAVTSHETRPGRLVFTERGNCDGWIATDLVVNVER